MPEERIINYCKGFKTQAAATYRAESLRFDPKIQAIKIEVKHEKKIQGSMQTIPPNPKPWYCLAQYIMVN